MKTFLFFVFFSVSFGVGSAKKIAIIMASAYHPDRYKASQIGIKSVGRYAKRWGYDFYAYEAPPAGWPYDWYGNGAKYNTSLHPAWNKINLFKYFFSMKMYDWIVWFDDDIIITREDVPLECFIKKDRDKDLILSLDPSHLWENARFYFNTGVIIAQCTAWNINFFNRVWDLRFAYALVHFFEQSAMLEVYRNYPDSAMHIKVLPIPVLQAFGAADNSCCRVWQPGDFLMHFAAVPYANRAFYMQMLFENPNQYPLYFDKLFSTGPT